MFEDTKEKANVDRGNGLEAGLDEFYGTVAESCALAVVPGEEDRKRHRTSAIRVMADPYLQKRLVELAAKGDEVADIAAAIKLPIEVVALCLGMPGIQERVDQVASANAAQGRRRMARHLAGAADVLLEVAQDKEVRADHRLKAAEMLLDRFTETAPAPAEVQDRAPAVSVNVMQAGNGVAQAAFEERLFGKRVSPAAQAAPSVLDVPDPMPRLLPEQPIPGIRGVLPGETPRGRGWVAPTADDIDPWDRP